MTIQNRLRNGEPDNSGRLSMHVPTALELEAANVIDKLVEAYTNNTSIGCFAPGSYLNRCIYCDEQFQGDKRALNCLSCALTAVTGKP